MCSARGAGHLEDALSHMRRALSTLDRHDAPAHIGARLDLAINQLAEFLRNARNEASEPAPVSAEDDSSNQCHSNSTKRMMR